MSQPRPTLRTTVVLGTTALALAALSACGSSSSASGTNAGGSAPSAQADGAQGGRQAGGFQGRNPGTSGKIAAKQGTTLQVQNQTEGQVAVSYTAKTAITAQVPAALKDVKVGSCVTVTPATSASGSASSGTSNGVAAGTVRISAPVNGQCTPGFGGGFNGDGFGRGSRPSGAPSGIPSGMPSGMPSGRPSGMPSGAAGGRAGMMFASGKVTAVSGSGFTVASSFPRPGSAGGSTGSSTNVQVTVSGATTYVTTKTSDASVLKVGKCVVATGQADSTGAVTADRLVVSDPVNGSCESGFRFGGRGPQGGTADAPGDQGGAA
jgi:hypothetical protein